MKSLIALLFIYFDCLAHMHLHLTIVTSSLLVEIISCVTMIYLDPLRILIRDLMEEDLQKFEKYWVDRDMTCQSRRLNFTVVVSFLLLVVLTEMSKSGILEVDTQLILLDIMHQDIPPISQVEVV